LENLRHLLEGTCLCPNLNLKYNLPSNDSSVLWLMFVIIRKLDNNRSIKYEIVVYVCLCIRQLFHYVLNATFLVVEAVNFKTFLKEAYFYFFLTNYYRLKIDRAKQCNLKQYFFILFIPGKDQFLPDNSDILR